MKYQILTLLSILSILSIIILITSCKTVETPNCIKNNSNEMIISWGEVQKNNIRTYYTVNTNLEIYLYVQRDNGNPPTVAKIGKMTAENYCNLFRELQKTIIQVQALNSPGDVSNFIEINDPKNNMRFKALWNPEFTNKGNKEFKELFTKYQEAIPVKKK